MNNEEKILSLLETLVSKVDSLEHKVDSLEHKVDSLEHKVDSLEHKVDSLEYKVDRLEHRVDHLEHKVDHLGQDMQIVKNTTMRIENEHGKKLNALFDGYSQLYDISKEIRKDIANLQGSGEKHDLHIKWLESHQGAEQVVS